MQTIAYLRVSTVEQDLDTQRLAILDYAQQRQWHIDEFVTVQMSSRRNLKERGILDLLDWLFAGDILIVSELSRLGRSVGQMTQIVEALIAKRIRFVAIKEGIELFGKQDLQTRVMVTMFSLFAEIERDLISERTKEELTKAKAKGKLIGRPRGSLEISKLSGREAEIKMLLSKNIPKVSIAKIMGVSATAMRHFITTRQLI